MSLLHDSRPSPPPADGAPKFRPYACSRHTVTRARYITSNDPRGYLPVFEYSLNGQWLMVDADTGYVLWTGIWKALGNAKADIVKMLETQPDLAPQLRRIRGGYLKIQGTWINYEIALRLARRVAWPIRDDLVPIFGPTFPSTCLAPDQPGYGQLSGAPPRRRVRRRVEAAPPADADAAAYSAASPPAASPRAQAPPPRRYSPYPAPAPAPSSHSAPASHASSSHSAPHPPSAYSASYPPSSHSAAYAPSHASSSHGFYPSPHAPYPAPHAPYPSAHAPYPAPHAPYPSAHAPYPAPHHPYPPAPIHLPPISALTHAHPTDASAVLRRLRRDDDALPPPRPW